MPVSQVECCKSDDYRIVTQRDALANVTMIAVTGIIRRHQAATDSYCAS
jgi:hypothetical protein